MNGPNDVCITHKNSAVETLLLMESQLKSTNADMTKFVDLVDAVKKNRR